MAWNKLRIDEVARLSMAEDLAAFETVGLLGAEGVRVLDAGCYDGVNTAMKFAPYASVAHVAGVDSLAEAIDRARVDAPDDRFSYHCLDFETCSEGELRALSAMPEEGGSTSEVERVDVPSADAQVVAQGRFADDGSAGVSLGASRECGVSENEARAPGFDLVYFSHSLQHMRDPQEALRRAWRLLAPGGYVVVKATDDAAKLSFPDPDNVMRRLFSLFDEAVRPHTWWTAHTDRYLGQKLCAYATEAGFEQVRVCTFGSDTAGKTLEQRRALFERCVYFRRHVPECAGAQAAEEMADLVDRWGRMFEDERYYFLNLSFVLTARKPLRDEGAGRRGMSAETRIDAAEQHASVLAAVAQPAQAVRGGWSCAGRAAADASTDAGDVAARERGTDLREGPVSESALRVRPMTEDDLGTVMRIEIASFPDPWTPVAYALELRHNPCAHYEVAVDAQGHVAGYLGWWETPDGASLMHVAVDPALRRRGVARALWESALGAARAAGCPAFGLEVRASNEGARAFYRRMGFAEAGIDAGYYTRPLDDAVLMVRLLED